MNIQNPALKSIKTAQMSRLFLKEELLSAKKIPLKRGVLDTMKD